MRIHRLDLIRYGCFTDLSISLPACKADLHIVHGPNEAGKSTALAAFGDLLFGIPNRTPFGYRHELKSLRVGARLEGDPGPLEVIRRKGAKDTLLGPDGHALVGGEAVLSAYLAGADRSFIERMFGLDHARLRAGGREILEAKDDVGRMLFSAGTGIENLREHLDALRAEADELFSRRRAKHRAFYVALDRLNEADEALRERVLSADQWHELKRALEVAEEACAGLDAEIRKGSLGRDRLSRVRRVYRHVQRQHELDATLESLGDVVLLPEDAGATLTAAKRAEADAGTAVATLGEEAERVRADLADLQPDEDLLARSDAILTLRDRCIETRGRRSELLRHEAELEAAETELARLGAELAWEADETVVLAARVPAKVQIGVARSLLTRRAALDAELRAETLAVREIEADLERRRGSAAHAPELVDVTDLVQAIDATRARGDLAGRVRIAETRLADLRSRAERALSSLEPGVESGEALAALQVPARHEVERHREGLRNWRERLSEARSRAASLRRELGATKVVRERLLGEGGAVSSATVDEERARRDALFNLVKRRHVEGAVLDEEMLRGHEVESEDLVGAYERTVVDVDALLDRRFEHAEAAGRLAEVERAESDLGGRLAECEVEREQLRERGGQLTAAWTARWHEAPFEPSDPEPMLAWLEARAEILGVFAERRRAERDLEALRTKECNARRPLAAALGALGFGAERLETLPLTSLIELALDECRRRDGESEARARLLAECEKARTELERRNAKLTTAREARSSWEESWDAAVVALGLDADRSPDSVEPKLEIIERAREVAGRIEALHGTVARIRQDIARFDDATGELARAIARDLEGAAAEEVALELERRLAEAVRVRSLRRAKDTEAKSLEARIAEHREALARAARSLSGLMTAAGVESSTALEEAIDRSDRRRVLEAERTGTLAKLREDGDGFALDVLEPECAAVDLNEAAAKEGEIQAKLEALQHRLAEAAEERSRARDAFERLGGSDAAARAAADREDALADLRDIAARYVRTRGSALLLEWVIERYRRERQAPLLARAGELFETLTAGSFTGLGVEYDARDRPGLVGVRPGGGSVPVSGLSSGTADQLFLALRIGAVEEYIAKAGALPFIADDLFIHFDDQRAAAGLKVLERLSRKTQVIFFTHHQHLVNIARQNLEPSLDVIDLSGGLGDPAATLEAA